MPTTFDRLRLAIERQVSSDADVFKSGMGKESVEATLAETGLKLPAAYIDFLASLNGQGPTADVFFPPGQLKFLSLDEAMSLWRELKDYEDEDDMYFNEISDDGRIRSVVYDRRRFPIAYYELGTQYLFIDNIPGPSGVEGQIIFNPSEATFEVVASSFESMIDFLVDALENGTMRLARMPPEYGTGFWFETPQQRHVTFDVYHSLMSR